MNVIYDELRDNGIVITKITLMHYINEVYNKYAETYYNILSDLSFEDLIEVWGWMNSTTFGHTIAYLTLVYCSNIRNERKRAAVRVTIPLLRSLDISEYKVQHRSVRDFYVSIKTIAHHMYYRDGVRNVYGDIYDSLKQSVQSSIRNMITRNFWFICN